MLMPALFGLVVAAWLLAGEGEKERPVELYALAAQNPFVANSRWFEDVAGSHIRAVAATLPTAVVTATRERGQARNLKSTVGELLADLPQPASAPPGGPFPVGLAIWLMQDHPSGCYLSGRLDV
jgi:hypothetical protein